MSFDVALDRWTLMYSKAEAWLNRIKDYLTDTSHVKKKMLQGKLEIERAKKCVSEGEKGKKP